MKPINLRKKDNFENLETLISMLNSKDVRDALIASEIISTQVYREIKGKHRFRRILKLENKIANQLNIRDFWDCRSIKRKEEFINNNYMIFILNRENIMIREKV